MPYPVDFQRDFESRLGNWHDVVDEVGNGSIIAVLKSINQGAGSNGNPVWPQLTDRDLRNRMGNWNDFIDQNGNGSFIAQFKQLLSVFNGLGGTGTNLVNLAGAIPPYTVLPRDGFIAVDCTAQAQQVTFNYNTALKQETDIVKTAGNNPLTIRYKVGNVTFNTIIMNDIDVVTRLRDLGTRVLKVF